MTPLSPQLLDHAAKLARRAPGDIVAVYAMDQKCRWASPSHETILGYSQAEMQGKPWTDFVAPEDHDHANLAGSDALLMGRSIKFGIHAVAKSGRRIMIRGQASITVDIGTGTGYLLFQATPRD